MAFEAAHAGDSAEEALFAAEAAFRTGQADRGAELLRAALARAPLNAALWHQVSALLDRADRVADAAAAAMTAVRLEPGCLDYRLALAGTLQRSADLAAAITHYEIAADLAPTDDRVLLGLAGALAGAGLFDDAERLCRAVLEADDSNVRAHALLQTTVARRARQPPLETRALAQHHYRTGCLLQDSGQVENALSHYELAARLQPNLFGAAHNAGKLAAGFGLVEPARRYLSQAHRLRPQDGVSMRLELLSPAIHDSTGAIAATRARFDRGLDRILEVPPRIDDPLNKGDLPTFYLAYHGLCNRQLHARLATAFALSAPTLSWCAPHCLRPGRRSGRIRVGFISRFMRNHSIGKVARGLIAELSRERFEVYVLNIPPFVPDEEARSIQARADHWVVLADTLAEARAQIAAAELDILFYQDIGMEPFSYLLAFARLANIQCVSFGHPDTTGIPTMDYYVSSDLYEPAGASEHYSERLAQLQGLPTLAYYLRPPVPQALPSREQLGLPAHAHLYVCSQTLFKLHPDFDEPLKRILERDGAAQVLLFSGECAQWSAMLHRRFSRVMPDVADRIRFLPRQAYSRFLGVLNAADVVLDTPHFNGMTTSLEAFAIGAPVVTLPGTLQRGRVTAAMYRSMGITDGIAASAEEYADIAVALATDTDRQHALRKLLAERHHVLFEDRRVITEFERFFVEAHLESLGKASG